MPDLFISYSRKDGAFVKRLHGALAGRGRDVWVDWEDIAPAATWREDLHAGLEESRAVVFVISPDSLASRECAIELTRAQEGGKRIVPVLLRDPDGAEVPAPLAERNWIFFRDGEDDFDASVAALERAIDTDESWVRHHTRLLARASEWEARGRDASLLLRGTDLREAEGELSAWREGREPVPTGLQRELVAASRRAAGRRTATLGLASGVALLVSVAFAVFALIERNHAVDREREAKARGLAAAAAVQADSDPELSALLAVESVLRERTPEGEESLRRVVGRLQARGVLTGPPKGAVDVDVRDPRRVLSAGADGRVRVWDAKTGRTRVLARHRGGATAALAVPGGRHYLTSGEDGTARVIDARSGRQRVLRGPGTLYAGASDDGRTVVALDGRGDVRLWDLRSGRRRAVLPGRRAVTANVDRDAELAVLVERSGVVRTFDVDSGRELERWRGPASEFARAGMAPDGSFVVVVSAESPTAEVRDVRTGRVLHRLKGHRLGVVDVTVSLDGRRIVTGSFDNTARVWDARTGEELHVLRGHGDSTTQVQLSRDGRRVVTSSPDETVRVWATATGQPLTVLRPRGEIADVAVSPDGRHVVTAGADGATRLWEAAPGRTLALLRHRGPVEAATLDPTGRLVGTSGPDRLQFAEAATGRVLVRDDASLLTADPSHDIAFDRRRRFWAIADGHGAFVFRASDGRYWHHGHGGWVNSVSWDRAGRRVATAADDGTARVLDPRARLQAELRHGAGTRVYRARFTPDGRRLVTLTDDGVVHVWRLSDRREIHRLPARKTGATELDLAPDGRTVAANDGGTAVRLWRIGAPARAARTLEHKAFVNGVRFSRDGRLATASDDGTARVWDARTGRSRAVLRGHLDRVRSVDVSPDGRFLLTGGEDRTVRLWDLAAQRSAAVFEGHDGSVRQVRFAPDGRSILAAPDTGAVAVYACDACLPVPELVRRVRELAGRRLTAAERRRYLR